MERRIPFVSFAAATTLAVSVLAFSGAAVAHSSEPAVELAIWQVADGNQRFSISGTVESVSYASNSVRISAGGQHVDVLVTPTTAIEVGGESGSIADIRKGLKIHASGVVHDGQKIALSITLK